MQILVQLSIIIIASIAIMFACDTFETASRKLGSHFPKGIRGATINAIGSSLPELFTTFFLLFIFHDRDGFSGGIATCAGSAIFNAVVIPALCIMVVVFWGVRVNGKHKHVNSISVQRDGFFRDSFFFIGSEIVLIVFLSNNVLRWWMGGVLVLIYLLYVSYLFWEYRTKEHQVVGEDEDEDDDDDEEEDPSLLGAIFTLNFQWLLFRDKPITNGRAWVLLIIGATAIAIPCHFLATSCVELAVLLKVPVFFTTVILAAAATSVPDTIISIRDARSGDYDDAVSNAFGSNIFDINICLGLPLFLYGIVYGDVVLKKAAVVGQVAGEVSAVQELRILLLLITLGVFLIFVIGRTLGKIKAVMLFSLYLLFIGYTVGRAMGWKALEPIQQWLQFSFLGMWPWTLRARPIPCLCLEFGLLVPPHFEYDRLSATKTLYD